ncbi:MAG: LytR/AlgR family response regulator transcription factor [Thiobacillaceae bacterium]
MRPLADKPAPAAAAVGTLKVLVVDDEPPARQRLRDLLSDAAADCPNQVVGEAANGFEAIEKVLANQPDVVLMDIQMPGMNGLEAARHLLGMPHRPAVVFITAYDEFALQAFEVHALDYLMKPVRLNRLTEALGRVRPLRPEDIEGLTPRRHLCSTERGRVWLVPVEDVLYLRAELKYVTARTRQREYLLNESLVQLEEEFPDAYVRIHRNCLVARRHLAGFERVGSGEEQRWVAVLKDLPERLPVSRRQQHVIREYRG